MNIFTAISFLFLCVVSQAASSPLVFGYYSTWEKNATEAIGFSKYSHVIISFANPCKDGSFEVSDFDVSDAVTKINKDGAQAMVSIGGWSYSANFSSIMKDETASETFANNIVSYIEQYKLDGIDLDWEYPGSDNGQAGNEVDKANDTPNYLKFLQKLRKKLDSKFNPTHKLITIAVGMQTYNVDGKPLKDMSGFAKVVDYANLMLYDVYGSWSKTSGPNAPLVGEGLSFSSGIKIWSDAKWPRNQLIAGFAFYGHAVKLADQPKDISTNQYQPISKDVPQGDPQDQPVDGGAYSGLWQYKYIRSMLFTPSFSPKSGWERYWDSYAQTAYLFNKQNLTFISYDDQLSIRSKTMTAKLMGLPGGMVWSMHMDYNNELVDIVRDWVNSDIADVVGSSNTADASSIESRSNAPTSSAPTASISDNTLSSLYVTYTSTGAEADNMAEDSFVQSSSTVLTDDDAIEYCSETIPSPDETDFSETSSLNSISSSSVDSSTSQITDNSSANSNVSQAIDDSSAGSNTSQDTDDNSAGSDTSQATGNSNADSTTSQATNDSSIDSISNQSAGTSSEPATASSSENTESLNGGKCSANGHQRCQQADGQGTAYSVCDHGRWVPMQCNLQTVCVQSGLFIQCDYSYS
ncbi:hypothetical protein IWW36_001426 [Coemansia brasiliensis]|uniref:GH18 domain-containing protein n=1 Tax=Coemansia brasiliensis TaxID=2650707 RepID=A0A9W8IGU0_9FUNG|nr:hypothetical protein IWW36_001426 [Coemansia brasiliensis]